jgi:GDPmannose 4,6-dehydratase
MRRVLILGVTGQDGQLLADQLIKKGDSVLGISRNLPNWASNPLKLFRPNHCILDTFDYKSLRDLIKDFQPGEIYNLSGESSVATSFSNVGSTINSNVLGTLNLLNAIHQLRLHKKTRIFQAASSEMFGPAETTLSESSLLAPVSPYGISKFSVYQICKQYREEFGLWISSGILFNHESELRSAKFVFQKVIKTLVEIKQSKREVLELGNLDVSRDWGYAGDYVDAMQRCLRFDHPRDFVIATGKLHSLRDLIQSTCEYLTLLKPIESLVRIDPSLKRVSDINCTWGNPEMARNLLGWTASTTFEEIIAKLVRFNLESTE